MTEILLYAAHQSVLNNFLIWFLLLALMVAFIVMAVWQRRSGKELQKDLELLDSVSDHNVQNDFVLKALQIATWHMDVDTMQLAYDSDFRERTAEWIAEAAEVDGHVDNGVSMLHEQDAPRVAQALGDLCSGKTEEYHEEVNRLHMP